LPSGEVAAIRHKWRKVKVDIMAGTIILGPMRL